MTKSDIIIAKLKRIPFEEMYTIYFWHNRRKRLTDTFYLNYGWTKRTFINQCVNGNRWIDNL
jgi:hypothetical protein